MTGKYKDLTGKLINNIQILKREPSETKKSYWKCKCFCGNEFVTTAASLNRKSTMSCGCIRSDNSRCCTGLAADLTDEIFGYWTVLKRDYSKLGHVHQFFICKCWCGKIKSVAASSLKNGRSKSCGCMRVELTLATKGY